jgi:Heterokaryon incompatibility protein (HET)
MNFVSGKLSISRSFLGGPPTKALTMDSSENSTKPSNELQHIKTIVPRELKHLRKYVHEPMKTERHIRFLRLKNSEVLQRDKSSDENKLPPTSSKSLPFFEIVQADMSDLPKYQAVSYTWGKLKKTHHIKISSEYRFAITKSLATALRQLVHDCYTGYLWIDQICIDQTNIEERNHQVGVMGDIYKNAEEVMIYTGAEIRRLDELEAHVKQSGPINKGFLEPLLQLICRPWFTRVWVVQEAALARKATVVAGSFKLPLLEVANVLNRIEGDWASEETPGLIQRLSFIRLILILRKDWSDPEEQQRDFGSILNDFGACLTSDIRDHVYAFLGLQPDSRISIVPNYELTTEQVFTGATRAIIEGTKQLDILEFVARRYRSSPTYKGFLPSWVPNFSGKHDTLSICRDRTLLSGPPFDAAKCFQHRPPIFSSPNASQTLQVRGRVIDRVEYIIWANIHALTDEKWHHSWDNELRRRFSRENLRWLATFDKSLKQWSEAEKLLQVRKRLVAVHAAGQVHNLCSCCTAEWNSWRHPLAFHAVKDLLSSIDFGANLEDLGLISRTLNDFAHGNAVVITEGKKFALAPSSENGNWVQDGDTRDAIAILHGSRVPVVLREVTGGYKVVGQCYLEDAMFGEAVTWEEHEADTLTLV